MFRRTTYILLMMFILASILTAPAFAMKVNGKAQRSVRVITNAHIKAADQVAVVAHRGASEYAPENTMAAFYKAMDMGADYVELDVQRTKDGELVVIHDPEVDRTTNGTGNVKDLMLDEIQTLDAGSWLAPEFSGEKVPLLEDVLEEFHGKVGILIELKLPERYPGIEEELANVLKKLGLFDGQQGIIIQSFSYASVQRSKTLLPDIPHGVLAGMALKNITDEELGSFAEYTDYFIANQNMLTSELIRRIHSKGMRAWAYTTRTEKQAERLLSLGADGIITGNPYIVRSPYNRR